MEDIAYSICYLKNHKLIVLGMEKKIMLYDLLFNVQRFYNCLDNKVSYIYELNNGNILLTDLNKKIKILKIDKKQILVDKIIETNDERNFVGVELSNEKIIVGGNIYLSIIEDTFWYGYQLQNSIPLNSFISNIIELNSEQFLIGQSHVSKIIVCSSNNNKIIRTFSDINLYSNNYSISKISEDYVAIAGSEKLIMSGCVYIFSIKQLSIIQKKFI